MDLTALAIFASALLIAAGSPGPSIAALVARVLVRGWRDVLPFLSAMWIGELVWLVLAVAGLAAVAEAYYLAFTVLKYLGVAYLAGIGSGLWAGIDDVRDQWRSGGVFSPSERSAFLAA